MNMPTIRASRPLPHDTRERMQTLLNEADTHWFLLHPGEQHRERLYFRGERVDDHGQPTRYIIVSRDPDGRLLRRFEQNGGEV